MPAAPVVEALDVVEEERDSLPFASLRTAASDAPWKTPPVGATHPLKLAALDLEPPDGARLNGCIASAPNGGIPMTTLRKTVTNATASVTP